MSLVSSDAEGEQNEIRSLQEKLESTMRLVANLSGQLTELKEQVENDVTVKQALYVFLFLLSVTDNFNTKKKKKGPIVHALSYRLRKGHKGLTQIQWLTLNCAGRLTLFILSVRPPWCEARSHIKMFF